MLAENIERDERERREGPHPWMNRIRAAAEAARPASGLEERFDAVFTSRLAMREKQIQQNYRPVIGIHKWFARRPGTVFRSLLLAEYGTGTLEDEFFTPHAFRGVIADPFMGGGTPIYEANRLGFHVIGCDINPMAHWIVRQALGELDLTAFHREAAQVVADVEEEVCSLYKTSCLECKDAADVKYFMWVKTVACDACGETNDLFPGYRLAEAVRHPRHVVTCSDCGALGEYEHAPTRARPARCLNCSNTVQIEGNAKRGRVQCRSCSAVTLYPRSQDGPPQHRLWAVEYHCLRCYAGQDGRMFKAPDDDDAKRVSSAKQRLLRLQEGLPIPKDPIPKGDETNRLHRWGYRHYREMFGDRQLLGLGLLLARIRRVDDPPIRHALLTVFSDTLRYQNMLCRYDTWALKCQDIFSVHGFPVGLVQCENNLLGIPRVGSGSFRHFVEKYARAKEYCAAPFEIRHNADKKQVIHLEGETISAKLVTAPPEGSIKAALLVNAPSQRAPLAKNLLDGVFTDPPYFDNVQYAELIDFCFAWLRPTLETEFGQFAATSTRSSDELTGNATLGRGLEHFTDGLSQVFTHFAGALKPRAPFVFTYHHNDPTAYLPLIVAILDAGLQCTATLPAAAEMSASLHIAGTSSSTLDSVFVCRPLVRGRLRSSQIELPLKVRADCLKVLTRDAKEMRAAGIRVTLGDLKCLLAGHIARHTIQILSGSWKRERPLPERMLTARQVLVRLRDLVDIERTLSNVHGGETLLSPEELRKAAER